MKKVRLPFACKYGAFKQGQEVTDERVIAEFGVYLEELETKPAPELETKPAPKPRKRRTKKVE